MFKPFYPDEMIMLVNLQSWGTDIAYVYDIRMMFHSPRNEHTEAPDRISRVHDILSTGGYLDLMAQIPVRQVEREEVLLVHSENLWEKVMSISGKDPTHHLSL